MQTWHLKEGDRLSLLLSLCSAVFDEEKKVAIFLPSFLIGLSLERLLLTFASLTTSKSIGQDM